MNLPLETREERESPINEAGKRWSERKRKRASGKFVGIYRVEIAVPNKALVCCSIGETP